MRDSFHGQHQNDPFHSSWIGGFLLAIIFIVGCYLNSSCTTARTNHAFKVYDCVVDKDTEPWESPKILKIEMVGKHNYLVKPMPYGYFETVDTTRTFGSIDDFYERTNCPKEEYK